MVRKGRTILTGLAIAIGVASVFSMMVLGTSGLSLIERQIKSSFGFCDIRVTTEPEVDQESIAKKIAGLPGVKGAAVEKVWPLRGDLKGKQLEFAVKAIDDESNIAPTLYPLSSGRLPNNAREIALSREFASEMGYKAGQTFPLPLEGGTKDLTIVGLVNDGPRAGSTNAIVYVYKHFLDDFGSLSVGDYGAIKVTSDSATIHVMAKSNQSIPGLATDVRKVKGVSDVGTIDEVLMGMREGATIFTAVFGAIGGISLLVCATLVYTAFAITATQREREFGLLKAIGANRRWVKRLVYREAAILGITSSIFGILIGLVLVLIFLKVGLASGVFQGIESSDLVVMPQVVLASIIAGIIITLLSTLLPAKKVGKIFPLAAIRPQPEFEQKVGRSRWIGLVLVIIGAAGLLNFTFMDMTENLAFLMAVGSSMVIYLGTAIAMPAAIGPLFIFIERISLRGTGIPGKLAARNMGRHSLRSARTVTSILVGISLVYLVAIFTASAIASGNKIVEEQVKYDLVISPPEGAIETSIPRNIMDEMKGLKEVELVTTIKSGVVKVDDESVKGRISEGKLPEKAIWARITAIDTERFPQLSGVFFPNDTKDERIWSRLDDNHVLIGKDWAKTMRLEPGFIIKLLNEEGNPVEFEWISYFEAFLIGGNRGVGGIIMSQQAAERYLGISEDSEVLIKLKDGADKAAVLKKIKQMVKDTQFRVLTNTQITGEVNKLMEGPRSFFYLILGIAVLVSLLGVVNTMALGVLERRREIGLIKAVGGTGRQVRLAIILETILTSLTGTVLGILLSVGISVAFFVVIYRETLVPLPYTIPTTETLLLLFLVVAVSMMGATFPVRLANKVTPVEALRAE